MRETKINRLYQLLENLSDEKERLQEESSSIHQRLWTNESSKTNVNPYVNPLAGVADISSLDTHDAHERGRFLRRVRFS